MSLLMDALRKAEQQKRQGTKQPDSISADHQATGLSLEPLAEPSVEPSASGTASAGTAQQRLPDLPKRMEELDDQFFTTDPGVQKSIRALADTKIRDAEKPAAAKAGAEADSRAAAQNIFTAKQTAPAVGYGFAVTVSIATLIAVAAIGSYFYWQLQPKGGLGQGPALSARTDMPMTLPAASAVQRGPSTSPLQAPSIAPVVPTSPAKTENQTVSASPAPARVATPDRLDSESKIRETPSAPARTYQPSQAVPSAPIVQPDTVIRFSTRAGKADGTMQRAHEAFTRGETDLARSIWLRTLQNDPRNINALHGLAALVQQEGRTDQAEALYRRVLEVDPKDATANAALFALSAPIDAHQAESQLKVLLAEQPTSPQLNFALGNLFAGTTRWAEAQQAYFKAHVADAANPDYLYNLAISLDHLHQSNLAAQYYARALAAAKLQAAAFDPAQAEDRMKMLQSGRAD